MSKITITLSHGIGPDRHEETVRRIAQLPEVAKYVTHITYPQRGRGRVALFSGPSIEEGFLGIKPGELKLIIQLRGIARVASPRVKKVLTDKARDVLRDMEPNDA